METKPFLTSGTSLQSGKYKIVKTLGQGGFGITYEAEQVVLNRRVAIKEFFMKEYCDRDATTSHVTLGTSQGSKDLVGRFQTKFVREAQMIAGFDKPNIIKIYDVFEENGTAYYVMAFLDGGSLADKVKQEGPLPETTAIDYIRQIGNALSYIHRQNVLHLDVKPSNVLLNSDGEAVLIDFGISKHYDAEGGQTSTTPVGISKGYAPMEQYQQGNIAKFSPAADVYSLGATLYHLLTGSVPPEASIVNEDGLDRPAGLSDRTWEAIRGAMQPRRKDRPQTVEAFLKLLEDRQVVDSEEDEKTVIVGATPKPKSTESPAAPKPKPNPKEPSPAPPTSAPKAPSAPAQKPSRRGLWIGLAAGVAVLTLILLLVPRHKPEPANPGVQADSTVVEQVAVEPTPAADLQQTSSQPQTGSARITSTPAGAQIWLDGKNTKKVTPEILEDLPAGKHSVKLVLDGYEDYSGSITVTSDKRAELTKALTEKAKPQTQSQVQTDASQTGNDSRSSGGSTTGSINGHEWVDLGLSVKWATCNVGASSPSDYGRYYAWGETSTKNEYTWGNYKYHVSGDSYENVTFSKYNTSSDRGTVDTKSRLDRSDDAARANWGGTWRIPTDSEWTELRTKCNWKWTSQGGKNGYRVTGPNGNSIFLPAAGFRNGASLDGAGARGDYWSSSLTTGNPLYAWGVSFDSGEVDRYFSHRCLGFSVRSVSE